MKLKDITIDLKVFIDTNIITYHLSGHSVFGRTCRDFLKNVEIGQYEGYINEVVVSEVLLNFIKSELFRQRGIKPHMVVREIKREPSLIELVNFDAVTKLFDNLGEKILPIDYKCKQIVAFIGRYLLLRNDAIHVATMKRHGITSIATNDPDFKRVGWLKVWKP